jgi:adenylate cyclase
VKQLSFYKRWQGAFHISWIAAAVVILFSSTSIYQRLELKALDLRFSLASKPAPDNRLVHIDIDDSSIQDIGRWPWPRTDHASLVKALTACGAKFIAYDVLFVDPSAPILNTASLAAQEDTTEKKSDLLKQLLILPDEKLADALKQSDRTYLPLFLDNQPRTYNATLMGLLREDFHIDFKEALQTLSVDEVTLQQQFTVTQMALLDEIVSKYLSQDSHISFARLVESIQKDLKTTLYPSELEWLKERVGKTRTDEDFASRFGIQVPANPFFRFPQSREFIPPIALFAHLIHGSGFVNMEPDPDGVLRRIPLFWKFQNHLFFQHFFKVLCDELKVSAQDISFTASGDLKLKGEKNITIPLDREGRMILNWSGPWNHSFPHLPAHVFVHLGQNPEPDPVLQAELTRLVKDKICIIGLTATGTHDMKPTPLEATSPGVSVHSNLMNTILSGQFIRRVWPAWNWVTFFLTAFLLSFPFSYFKPTYGAILAFVFLAALVVVLTFLFDQFGWWIDLTGPALICVLEFAGITSYRYFTEEREKRWIRHAFKHYVSQNVVDEILADPKKLVLGGERKQLSVLFSDIRGFTTFSEKNNPEVVVKYLNEYMEAMTQVIFEYHGTVDKFVGDEIMAIFGAPTSKQSEKHAEQAVRCALAMNDKLSELQMRWRQEGREVLEAGIGINTGEMVVGNMGSRDRMDYTVIGDSVNLAARLCGSAKGRQILVPRSTFDLVSAWVESRALEPITVKGKSEALEVFEILSVKLR